MNINYALSFNRKGEKCFYETNYSEALEYFELAIETDQTESKFHSNKGFTLCKLNRLDEAFISYDKALTLEPSSDIYHNNKGLALLSLNRNLEALKHFSAAIVINPKNANYFINKGSCNFNMKKYNDALRLFDIAISIKPTADSLIYKSRTLRKLGNFKESLVFNNLAIDLDNRNASFYSTKAITLSLMNKNTESIQSYNKALELERSHTYY